MARNSLSYEGRIIDKNGQTQFGKAGSTTVLKLVIAEQHTMKNGKAPEKYQDKSKGVNDYVPTTTSWHRVTIFGDQAEACAQDADFNHGAIVDVSGASYVEEDPWETKDGVLRAGRPETIGDSGNIAIHEYNGRTFGPREPMAPIWDGVSEIPKLKGSGGGNGGGAPAVEYSDTEGF